MDHSLLFDTPGWKAQSILRQAILDNSLAGVQFALEHGADPLLPASLDADARKASTFDLCSAPFGTSWFFSYRFCEIPAPFPFWQFLIVIALTAVLAGGYVALFGALWGGVIIGMTALGFVLLLRNTLTLGFEDFDAWLLTVPIFGRVYEALFRKETFFRQDTRFMYVEMMERIIQAKIKEVTVSEGIEKVEFIEARPEMHPLLARLVQVPTRTSA